MRGLATVVLCVLVLGHPGCGGDRAVPPGGEAETEDAWVESAGSGGDRAPVVEEAYQGRIDEAWRKAGAAENPAATCAGVKGRAVSAPAGSADRALAACTIDIPARYFLAYVDEVEAGRRTCVNLMTEVTTRLSSMTLSAEGFRDLARQGAGGDTSAAAAAGAATAMLAGETAPGGGAGDPGQTVKDRLRDRVTEVCPREASLILR